MPIAYGRRPERPRFRAHARLRYSVDETFFLVLSEKMTPAQCRAGRAWLSWSQKDLAKKARVGLYTVKDFEGDRRTPIEATHTAMRVALEREGIGFCFETEDGESYASGILFSRQNKADA
jgi:hypothetical protein